jgi:acylphosphatase
MKTYKYTISGKVQGVWFRASTKEIALDLDMTGYADNLPSGQVEVMAKGTIGQHKLLQRFLAVGPVDAEVSKLESEEVPESTFESFTIG